MMKFVLKMMNFVFKMMDFALNMMKIVQLTWREEAFQTIDIGDERIVVANDRIRVYEVLPCVLVLTS